MLCRKINLNDGSIFIPSSLLHWNKMAAIQTNIFFGRYQM